MIKKFNPFQPNAPIYPGLFAGRLREIERIDEVLFHTKNGNPTYILIIGERGIGKTSLLQQSSLIAAGNWHWEEEDKHNFMVVHLSIAPDTTILDLSHKIARGIERAFKRENDSVTFFKEGR